MSYVIIALSVLFAMCDAARPPFDDARMLDHPSPQLRFWNALSKVGEYYDRSSPSGLDQWSLVTRGALLHVQSLSSRLGCKAFDFEDGYEKVLTEIRRLESEVEGLGSQLNPVQVLTVARRESGAVAP